MNTLIILQNNLNKMIIKINRVKMIQINQVMKKFIDMNNFKRNIKQNKHQFNQTISKQKIKNRSKIKLINQ